MNSNNGNPWAEPVPHPLTFNGSRWEWYVPRIASVTEPLTIGVDAWSGNPLQVSLWAPKGARAVAVSGMSGSGVSTVLENIAERVTACADAELVLGVPAGLEFAAAVIEARQATQRSARVHEPSVDEPVFVVVADDTASLAQEPGMTQTLATIAARGRTEGVALASTSARTSAERWPSRRGGHWVSEAVWTPPWGDRHASVSTAVWSPRGLGTGTFGITEALTPDITILGRVFAPGAGGIAAGRLADAPRRELEPALAHLQEQFDEVRTWDITTGTTAAFADGALLQRLARSMGPQPVG